MWPNKRLDATARHEAGHAVAMVRLSVPFTAVVAKADGGGVHCDDPHPDFLDTNFSAPGTYEEALNLEWRDEARAFIHRTMVTFSAGPLAQMQYEGQSLPGDLSEFYLFGGGNDRIWVRGYALGLATLETSTKSAALERRWTLIDQALETASKLVQAEREPIEAVARCLIQAGRLSRDEVVELIGDGPVSASPAAPPLPPE